jgi:hypothetical protein
MGLVKLSLKPTILGSVVIGGILFGLGWGWTIQTLIYCIIDLFLMVILV